MDTQTAFFMNGEINIYPCLYEMDKGPLTFERSTSYPGRITVMENGNTKVRPYKLGSQGPRYEVLFVTDHCSVLLTQAGTVIERWKFDHRLSITDVWKIRKKENAQILSFYKSLK